MAKLKFKDMPGDKRMKDLAQSNWVSETCRNIQVQVIKTTAFNNRLALKSSFGMDYVTINCFLDQFLILLLIQRTLYHLHQKADLSTSINISFEKIY